MLKKAAIAGGNSVFTGVSMALSVCWLLLQFSFLSSGPLSESNPVLFMPLAFAGLLCAVILLRFLIRKRSAHVSAALQILSAALGASLIFMALAPPFAFTLAFVFSVCLFFALVRQLIECGCGPVCFMVSALALAAFILVHRLALAPFLDGKALHAVLSLLLPAVAAVLLRTASALERPVEQDIAASLSPGAARAALAVSLAGLLVCVIQLRSLRGAFPAYADPSGLMGGGVFLVMMLFLLWLRGRGRFWQALYAVLASFALGALLYFARAGFSPVFFSLFPLMLLYVSLAGMLSMFFLFCRVNASPINRPLACGAAYVVSAWALAACFGDLPAALPEDVLSYSAMALTAVVLLLAPTLFRGVPARPETPEVSADPAPRQAPDDEEVFDFGSLTKQLTNSEKKVFELILSGYSNQQIADELFISINTVKFHIRNVLAKIGVQRKSELLAVYAKSRQTAEKP